APRALRVGAEQVDEDRHERARERGVGDERAYEIRNLERDRERVDRAARTEVIGGDDLADEAENAGHAGGDGEDRGRDGEAPPRRVAALAGRRLGRRDDRRLGGRELIRLAVARRLQLVGTEDERRIVRAGRAEG